MEDLTTKNYFFGDFELDTTKRRLLKSGETVALNAKAFDLLLVLVEARGQVVSKDALFEKVWPGQFVEENNLTVHVSALRKIFGDKKGEHNFIVTVPGKGYSFVAELEEAGTSEIVVAERSFSRITIEESPLDETLDVKLLPGGNAKRHTVIYALLGLAVLALVVFVGYQYFNGGSKPKINSLAVLPFTNETQSADTEYLSDGLSDSVTYSLSQLPDLRVMSRNSVFRYKGGDADAKKIGQELKVQAILTGRVTQRGDDLIVNVELIDASNNAVHWGEQFTRKMTNISLLQNDIAKAISGKIRLKLSGENEKRLNKQPTQNAKAYQLYLQGLYYLQKRTPENIERGNALFQQAIDEDPAYAQAYAALALGLRIYDQNSVISQKDRSANRLRGKALALKAIELDEATPEAHMILAQAKIFDWDLPGAENEYKRAIEIDPNLALAHQWYSELLARLEKHEQALAEIKIARQLDPFSRSVNMNVGLRYMDAGKVDEAAAEFDRLIETEPDYPMALAFRGDVYERKEMFAEASEFYRRAWILLGETPENAQSIKEAEIKALETGGKNAFWKMLLEGRLKRYEAGHSTAYEIAITYAKLGDREKVFEWLNKAKVGEERQDLTFIKVEHYFHCLKDDPRYIALVREIGLPE